MNRPVVIGEGTDARPKGVSVILVTENVKVYEIDSALAAAAAPRHSANTTKLALIERSMVDSSITGAASLARLLRLRELEAENAKLKQM